jgi:RHS repeat-associated protein
MVVDKTGSLAGVTRHDYLPFGEELGAGAGGRAQGYGAVDNVRQQFTGYERDGETNLDYAQARYFASTQGRFTSVDPLLASGRPPGPQTWNRYAYALNSPLRYTDPTGMEGSDIGTAEDQRRRKQAPPPKPQVVDVRKDKTINEQVEQIKKREKEPTPGQAPMLTSIVVIPGETYNVTNATIVDGYGVGTEGGWNGVLQPIAYVPLDQNGNIMPSSDVGVVERISRDGGPAEQIPREGLARMPDGGVFIDMQGIMTGEQTSRVRQMVMIVQPSTKRAYTVGENTIVQTPPQGRTPGSITFTQGPTRRFN